MKKYKIGQLSKSMGVSTHLLKHYEKFNLLYPTKDSTTNYRYYDIGQCFRIIESKRYRNMGFSLKDTAQIVNELSNEEINELIKKKVSDLEEQIALLEHQKELALSYYNDCMENERRQGEWYIEELEEFYFIPQTENRELIEEGYSMEGEWNIIDDVPIAKPVLHLEEQCFTTGELFYQWGIGITRKELERVKGTYMLEEQGIWMTSSKRAFVTYIKLESPYMDNGRMIQTIIGEYRCFEYNLTRDAYAQMVKSVLEGDRRYHYFKVFVPIA